MATVELRTNESQEQLLRRFGKKIQNERVLSDLRKKRFFMSTSERKRIALRKAKRRERNRKQKMESRMNRYQ